MQIKRADGKGKALRCGNERVLAKGGNMLCKLKGYRDLREGNVQMKRWIQKGFGLVCVV